VTTTEVKARPILFSGPMVRALLSGAKTQTRRVVRLPDDAFTDVVRDFDPDARSYFWRFSASMDGACQTHDVECPYGKPGDRLFVKETFAADVPGCEFQDGWSYRADHIDPRGDGPANPMRWRPSIHMPRRASRITLEITGVRVERVQEIGEEDAIAEGVGPGYVPNAMGSTTCVGHRPMFARLWDQINGKRPGCSWNDNPWVWAISFRRVEAAGGAR
jgi:hypothetical protein